MAILTAPRYRSNGRGSRTARLAAYGRRRALEFWEIIGNMRTAAIALCAALALTGCEREPTGKQVGTILGAAAGVLVGSQIGSGVGRAAAMVGLAVLGGWLGGELGEELTREDREIAGRTTDRALEKNRSGEAAAWSNPDTGAKGAVTPGPAYVGAQGPTAGQTCREIDVVVSPKGEATKRGTRTACRKPNGDWEVLGA